MIQIPESEAYPESASLVIIFEGDQSMVDGLIDRVEQIVQNDASVQQENVSDEVQPEAINSEAINDETYSDIEEFFNRQTVYEHSNISQPYPNTCDFCKQQVMYKDLRMCYTCLTDFCIVCAPPVYISVLQCCNYHKLVLWFCSATCRQGYTENTVRSVHNVQNQCV